MHEIPAVRFREYIESLGAGAAAELARRVGVSHTTVQRWRDGGSIPRKKHMQRLVRACGGVVTPADFYTPDRQSQPSTIPTVAEATETRQAKPYTPAGAQPLDRDGTAQGADPSQPQQPQE